MEYGWLITIFFTGGGLLAQAAYLKGSFGAKIEEHDKELRRQDTRINVLSEKVVFKDSCDPRHKEVDRRFGRLEHETE